MANVPADVALARLQGAAALAKYRKVPLKMPTAERQRLMDVLLRINEIAMATFDVLEADALSEHDVLVMLQLPEYCNTFTKGIEKHAKERLRPITSAHPETPVSDPVQGQI